MGRSFPGKFYNFWIDEAHGRYGPYFKLLPIELASFLALQE
jgi:hypothetical protein